MGRKDKGDI